MLFSLAALPGALKVALQKVACIDCRYARLSLPEYVILAPRGS